MTAEAELFQSDNSFVNWFNELVSNDSVERKIIRFFEKNDQYLVFGKDAHQAASLVHQTSTVIKQIDGCLEYVTLSQPNAVLLMKKALLELQTCVHVYSPEPRKTNSWILTRKASPGNLIQLEDVIFADDVINSAPVVMALVVSSEQLVGVAFCDASSDFTIKLAEFPDDPAFSNLESLIAQAGIKECLLSEDSNTPGIQKVLEKTNILTSLVKKSTFKNAEQELSKLMNQEWNTIPATKLTLAVSSAVALSNFLDLLSDEANLGMFSLQQHSLQEYMRLDASAIQALHVFPVDSKQSSLYNLLNKCKTSQGSRLLAQFLKQPLLNKAEIEKRLDIVESFLQDASLLQTLTKDCLRLFPDLHRLAKKFHRDKASLQDVVRIYQMLESLPGFILALQDCTGKHQDLVKSQYLEPFTEFQGQLLNLKTMIETTIDLEAADYHEYRIKPDFDQGLTETKQAMDDLLTSLNKEANQIAQDLNFELEKKLKFEKSPIYGHHMRLPRAEARKIGSKYIELATQKAGVLFASSKMKQLSVDYTDLQSAYQTQQQAVVKEVISITATYLTVLESLNQLVAHLDVMLAFASCSYSAPETYVRPTIVADYVELVRSRHPCVEVQDGISFIANDVFMDRETSSFQIISGPNMGGKSTFIRQVGICALMTQIGCFVPCEKAEICLFDAILARVGAGDCQVRGISTFMYEMLETSAILKCATENSLVIIDELGRGTSTFDGFGLAWAIAEHIATNIKCFAFFATHFHELTTMSNTIKHVKNKQVLVDCTNNQMTLLYKVVDGACDDSFGIHVAQLAQFPKQVVRLAKRKVQELEQLEESVWNSSKQSQNEGMLLIEQFLKDFVNDPLVARPENEFITKVTNYFTY